MCDKSNIETVINTVGRQTMGSNPTNSNYFVRLGATIFDCPKHITLIANLEISL